MKMLVVYDSVCRNTEKVAQTMAASLDTSALPVGEVTPEMLSGLNLWVVGSPTRGFRPTEDIAKLLKGLPKNQLAGVKVAAFDTRILLDTPPAPSPKPSKRKAAN
jgi:flavodoxin